MLATATTKSNVLLSTENFLNVFAEFLDIDVSAGDAASDTLNTYRRQLQQFLNWCNQHQLDPVKITKDDIKCYRHWMIKKKQFKPA
ncbi:MAG: phage integrase N-terminal SAM-like domain-containing protein, partial [Xenococcaceae cyanobacterium MO_167.B52]|nr:phage integrase N-terminal SAM-like domain-containing protein [Xenococcaceae cyanobacterium MO_167.B52]